MQSFEGVDLQIRIAGYSAGIWMFGQFVDRYATDGYGPPVATVEAIEKAGLVDDLTALDINYPFAGPHTIEDVAAALDAAQLKTSVITPVIYNRQFRKGAFTNPDPALRREVRQLVEDGIGAAHELGADYVKFWPGQDGHDYPFQADYADLWRLSVEGVRDIATAHPDTRFAIEYKPKEPRLHMLFGTAARTLLAIQEMDVDNVGVVLDMGHSLYANETPAEALQLVDRAGRLTGVEVNDNLRAWDDDLTVGSVHLIETIEFLRAVLGIGWTGLIQLDQFPFREDPVAAANTSISMIKRLFGVIERLDHDALDAAQRVQDALLAQEIVYQALLA